ncbi:hypothetical protein FRC12_009018 [Ceratobasidium sp. 428]|nr:hypothetical protein FRC12_009018 [Ceratobasidium sp. 428]
MENAGTFSSLTTTIGKLSRCIKELEGLVGTHEEYVQLAIDLNELFHVLYNTCFVGMEASVWISRDRAASLAQSIDKVIKPLWQRIEETETEQKPSASITVGEVLECYRQTRRLLARLVLNENPRMWKLPDEAMLVSVKSEKLDDEHPDSVRQNTRLNQLPHAPAARYDPSGSDLIRRHGCVPGTRANVLRQLQDWVYYNHTQKIYWLNGTAGAGKTTIAYTFCSQLDSAGKLAASFFCSRQLPACRDVNQILPAISYQLSLLSRPTRSAISDALELNTNIGELELSEQLERLVAGPLRVVKHTFPRELIIVIDALDECEDLSGVDRLLECLLKRERDLPVKFLITSRPSANILRRMQSKLNERSEPELRLHEVDRTIVTKDIRTYIQAELGHLSHPAVEVEKLTNESGALFAYAAVLVDSSRNGKPGAIERLKRILDTCSFSEQSGIYTSIIQGIIDQNSFDDIKQGQMTLVLRAVAHADEPLSIDDLADLLRIDADDLMHTMLAPLWSLLQSSPEGERVAVHHKSFSDYILDRQSPSGFPGSAQERSMRLAISCFDRIKAVKPPYNICKLQSSYLKDEDVPDIEERMNGAISQELLGACRQWGTYLISGGPSDAVMDALNEFLSTRLLLWMEILNLKRCMRDGVVLLGKVSKWLTDVNGRSSIRLLVQDAWSFMITYLKSPMSGSTPHIYISMFPFWGAERPVSAHYLPKISGLVKVSGSGLDIGTPVIEVPSNYRNAHFAAYSPSGRYVATLDGDAIQIVDAYSGDLTGTRLSCSSQSTIQAWDVKTGLPVFQPLDLTDSRTVLSVSYSPDGTRIVAGLGSGTIEIWNPRTGQSIGQPLEGHTNSVNSVLYSPDGSQIASGSQDKTIRIWDAHSGQPIGNPFEGHTGSVLSIAYSPDGARIASGSRDQTIRIWDVHSGQLIGQPLKGHTDSINCIIYSPDGVYLASGSNDSTIRVWDAHTRQPLGHPLQVVGGINQMAYSPDGAYIATCHDHRFGVRIWGVAQCFRETATGQLICGHETWVSSVAYSPDGARIASGSWDQTIRIWDAKTGQPISQPLRGHTRSINSVAYSLDGSRILSSSEDKTFRVWDAYSGQPIGQPLEGPKLIKSDLFAYSPDGTCVISLGEYRKTIDIWNIYTGQPMGQPLAGHTENITCVAYSPDGAQVVSGSGDSTIRIWDVPQPLGQTGASDSSAQSLVHTSDVISDTATSEQPNNHLVVQSNPDWTLDSEGWVVNSNQERLIWIPLQHQGTLLRPPNSVIISRKGSLSLDFESANLGENWVKCFNLNRF